MKFRLSLLLCIFSAGAFGASSSGAINTTTSSSSAWYDQLRESPASFLILSNNSFKRINNTSKIAGLQSANYLIAGYKVSSRGKLDLENLVIQDSGDKKTAASTKWNRITLKYTHKLLTQAKHGVNLSGAVDVRYHPEAAYREENNRTGHARYRIAASRSFDNGISLNATLYHYDRFNKDSKAPTALTSLWELFTVQTYNITDKFSTYLYEDTVAYNSTNNMNEPASIEVGAGVGYSFNKVFSGEFEIGNYLLKAHDKQTVRNDFTKTLGYTVNIYASLF